jgi:sugar phosphate isomerase/epimerase
MTEPTASIQLIIFGSRNSTDFAGVCRDVVAAGFPAIETGNLFASLGEDAARRLLDETGLKISGIHAGYGDYADDAKLTANIAFCKAIGVRHLMCSGVADGTTVEGYRTTSRRFNEIGKRLRDEGLVFNYHNHDWEFKPLDGGTNGMSVLAAETDPAVVKFNIDVFWVTHGGENPVAFIHQHADRAGYFHFKDGRKLPDGSPEFLELGRGTVDLIGSMQAAREVGAEWIVQEQDRTTLDPAESITISRRYMREHLGV